MKFLIIIFILTSSITRAQTPNVIKYKSDLIYRSLIENYNSPEQKLIDENVLGKDIEIFIDTIFKKYTIRFVDQDYKNQRMIFKHVSNYFGVDANDGNKLMRLYYMETEGEEKLSFLLIDYIDLFGDLDILVNEKIDGNRNLIYRIKNIKTAAK